MYADRLSPGGKRSLGDRFDTGIDNDRYRPRRNTGDRLRKSDDKSNRGLHNRPLDFQDHKVGLKDLRVKLQRSMLQKPCQIQKAVQGTRVLNEKPSCMVPSRPANAYPLHSNLPICEPQKSGLIADVAKLVKKSTVDVPASSVQKAVKSSSSSKTQKTDKRTVDALLRSLGLEKYLITFQAEEIDMAVLMHLTDEDLKALGIPMGPRKKILVALDGKP